MYDFIFSVPTYKSVSNAIRMLKSAHLIGKNCLWVVTGSIYSDVQEISDAISNSFNMDIAFFHSSRNNVYLNINWAYAWARHNGLEARYFSNIDDDIEFTPVSGTIFDRLELGWETYDPCLMGLRQTSHGYLDLNFERQDGMYCINPDWINGESMFVRWDSPGKYGLCDCLPESRNSFFTVSEYCHRLRYLTGRPVVVDCNDIYFTHHFREPGQTTQVRSGDAVDAMVSGAQLWSRKYGIPVPSFQTNAGEHRRLYNLVMKPEYDSQIKSSLLFGCPWNDWDAIYNKISHGFYNTVTGSRINV